MKILYEDQTPIKTENYFLLDIFIFVNIENFIAHKISQRLSIILVPTRL